MSVVLRNNIGAAIWSSDIMYASRKVVEQLVTAFIHNEVDGRVELMIDGQQPGVELTRSQMIEELGNVKDNLYLTIAECLDGLQHEMQRALERADLNIAVNSIKFDDAGEVEDVTADLTVTFSENIV